MARRSSSSYGQYVFIVVTSVCSVWLISQVYYFIFQAHVPEDVTIQTTREQNRKALRQLTSEKNNHKARTLSAANLERVAQLSDPDVFKEKLLKPFLRERVSGTDGNKAVQEHIKNYLINYGWHIEEDDFQDSTPYGKKPFTNIIATVNPLAPRRLTLACHFDSKYFTQFTFIGATDSAVPCAMLLDVARSLSYVLTEETNRKVSLQLLFLDGEEAFKTWTSTDSLYGARHLAKAWEKLQRVDRDVKVPGNERMDMMILLDLLGTKDVQLHSWFKNTDGWFKRMQTIEKNLAGANLLHVDEEDKHFFHPEVNRYFVSSLWGSGLGGIQDDHIPFHQRGVNIMHLIAYPFPHVWHKEADNESALNYDTIDNLNKIIRVFVAEYLHLRV